MDLNKHNKINQPITYPTELIKKTQRSSTWTSEEPMGGVLQRVPRGIQKRQDRKASKRIQKKTRGTPVHYRRLSKRQGTPPERKTLGDDRLAEQRISGRRALSAAGLKGQGSHKGRVFHRWDRNPRPQPQTFSKLVSLI